MRILHPLLLAASLLTSAAACVTDEASEGRPTDEEADFRGNGKGDGELCDFDQMPAVDYYKQFAYEQAVSSSGGKWYRIGSTFLVRPTLDDGNKADLKLYFLPEARVIAEYAELKSTGGNRNDVLNQTVIITRAKVDPATRAITIEGVGTGTPLTVTSAAGCAPGITFTFSSDQRSPGLANDGATIQSTLTSAFVIDPDHLAEVPNESARRFFEEDVASGKIVILRK